MAYRAKEKRLIIGLDYGTTFTGVAFADSSQTNVDNIKVVHNWPGKKVRDAEKVPSQISYGGDSAGGYTWGNKIPRGAKRYYWTKLDLDKQKASEELRAMLASITGDMTFLELGDSDRNDPNAPPKYPGREAKDVVADYLRGVREHVFSVLREHYAEVLDVMPIEVVITCPAVWSDKAKDLTFEAAKLAGFGAFKVSMLTEPEAAAVYAMKEYTDGLAGKNLKMGDHFVVCDAGGGTVDLISYKVTSLDPALQMCEAAIGTGDKCGGSFVDRSFQQWLKKKLGDNLYSQIPKDDMLVGGTIMNAFEYLKTEFGDEDADDDDYDEILRLPDALPRDIPNLGISGSKLPITFNDMESMFKPHVDRVIELLHGQNQQVKKNGGDVSVVFLVGGFSSSPYLYRKVKSWCAGENITLIRPLHPWSAIVRGAVARGLEGEAAGLVSLRLCRRFYGTFLSAMFVDGLHDEADKFIDEYTGETRAKGQMEWMVRKGDILPVNKSKEATISCSTNFTKGERRTFKIPLVACDAEEAPTRVMHDDAVIICNLSVDLTDVPDSKYLEISRRGQEPYFLAQIEIHLVLTGTMLEFKCMMDGEERGSVKASYT